MNDRQRLIKKVMSEVADPRLRDDLLRELVKVADPKPRPKRSVVMREMQEFGINPGGVQEFTKFQYKAGLISGYAIGILFAIGGLLGLFMAHGDGFLTIFSFFFLVGGVFTAISASKFAKIGQPLYTVNKSGAPPSGGDYVDDEIDPNTPR
jgi:hypothetical protein